MKGKRGRPRIPFANISNRKNSGFTALPEAAEKAITEPEPKLARGGVTKRRLDKKARSKR